MPEGLVASRLWFFLLPVQGAALSGSQILLIHLSSSSQNSDTLSRVIIKIFNQRSK